MNFSLKQLLPAAGALLVSMAAWAAPTVSVPSAVRAGEVVNLSGQGFAAGSIVTLRVTAQTGAVSMSAVAASASGAIAHAFTPSAAGKVRIEFMNAAGAVLAAADMGVAP